MTSNFGITDGETEQRQVMAAADEETMAIGSGDVERYFAILTEDAVFLPPNLMPLTGKELRQWLRDFLNQVAIEFLQSGHGETVVARDWAWHEYTCSWRATPKSGAPPAVLHFKGAHLIRRAPDGTWKLARNIWNLNPAPSAAA
jgi:ketosteroid isomerase-like protein